MSTTLSMHATNLSTDWLPVGQATLLSVSVKIGSSFAWGSAVIELQHSFEIGLDELDRDRENAQSFSPAVTLTTSTTYVRNVPIANAGNIRLKVTTADGGADPQSIVSMVMR